MTVSDRAAANAQAYLDDLAARDPKSAEHKALLTIQPVHLAKLLAAYWDLRAEMGELKLELRRVWGVLGLPEMEATEDLLKRDPEETFDELSTADIESSASEGT